MSNKHKKSRIVCTQAVRVAKHLVKHGYIIRDLNTAISSRSCYLKIYAQHQKVTIRISDHAPQQQHFDGRRCFNYSTRKPQTQLMQALITYLQRLTETGA